MVPEGTVAEFIGVWDNSEDNPVNPDPTWCNCGERTVDEMFTANVFYTPQAKLAKPVEVEDGRRTDPSATEPEAEGSTTLL